MLGLCCSVTEGGQFSTNTLGKHLANSVPIISYLELYSKKIIHREKGDVGVISY